MGNFAKAYTNSEELLFSDIKMNYRYIVNMTVHNCNQAGSYVAFSGHNPYPTKSSICSYL